MVREFMQKRRTGQITAWLDTVEAVVKLVEANPLSVRRPGGPELPATAFYRCSHRDWVDAGEIGQSVRMSVDFDVAPHLAEGLSAAARTRLRRLRALHSHVSVDLTLTPPGSSEIWTGVAIRVDVSDRSRRRVVAEITFDQLAQSGLLERDVDLQCDALRAGASRTPFDYRRALQVD